MRHIILATIIAGLFLSSLSFGYSGGSGTSSNPYQIATKADLLALAATTTDYSKCFILTADINMGGQVFTTAIIASNTSTSSPFQGTKFTGSFNGDNHVVHNYTINGGSNDYLGLFGFIDINGQVENLGLETFSITGTSGSEFVGGLVGEIQVSCHISNCYAEGSVSGYYCVGGLAGRNSASCTHCYSAGTVDGYQNVGGLMGDSANNILNCYSTGAVSGTVGVGGLIGLSWSNVDSCYASGIVDGHNCVGGLVGENRSIVINCYATGDVIGFQQGAGLVGFNYGGSINRSYSTGLVSGDRSYGGLVAYNENGHVYNSFWDIEASGQTVSDGGTGKTMAQMKTLSTFTSAGWDFSAIDGDPADWYMPVDNYPMLLWQMPPVLVPEVIGMTQAAAESAITSIELIVGSITFENHDSIAAGNVISQLPAAGTEVNIGSAVNLVVSLGAALPIVPNVVGMSQADAELAIISACLVVGNVTYISTELVPAGYVISQSPEGGAEVAVGSAVNLVVELGMSVTVPDVAGMSQAEAESAIISVGLVVGTIDSTYDYAVPAGSIVNQFPVGGTEVGIGFPVNLIVSLGRGGDGTLGNPYQIACKTGLLAMAATTTDYDKYFILTADIDMTGQVFTTAIIAPDTDSNTSGFQGTSFFGSFDGNNHIIKNFIIDGGSNDYLGLFGATECYLMGTEIKNLGIEDISIFGNSDSYYVGGLVGCVGCGLFSYCSSEGFIEGSSVYAGGLFGSCDMAYLDYCYSTVDVSGSSYAGGLIGFGGYNQITHCYSTGDVIGSTYIGGLMGLGYDENSISQSYASGNVSGSSFVGGLVGRLDISNGVDNCYSTGDVGGTSNIGGLVGYLNVDTFGSSVNKCYSTGHVSGTSNTGGLVGYQYTDYMEDTGVYNSFWDIETSGWTTSDGGIGKTTAEMMTLSTFTSAGWDFSGPSGEWMMLRPSEDYPRLFWQDIIPGDIAGLYGVNTADLMEVVNNWLEQGCPTGCEDADIDGSGTIDLADYSILTQHW